MELFIDKSSITAPNPHSYSCVVVKTETGVLHNRAEQKKLYVEEVSLPGTDFVTLCCGILTVTSRARFRARLFYQAEWNV